MAKLNSEVKRIISEIHPALVATSSRSGRPNVAPKGSFRVLDDDHVIFVEGGRMHTLANLRENPQLSALVFDTEKRQGCRIWGKAEILESGELFNRIAAESASRGMKINHIIKVAVDDVITF